MKSKLIVAFAVLAVALVAASIFASYRLGLAVGQAREIDSTLTKKLSYASLLESIDYTMQAHEANLSGLTQKSDQALGLLLFASMRQLLVGIQTDPGPVKHVLCGKRARVEKAIGELAVSITSGAAAPREGQEYIDKTFSDMKVFLSQNCT